MRKLVLVMAGVCLAGSAYGACKQERQALKEKAGACRALTDEAAKKACRGEMKLLRDAFKACRQAAGLPVHDRRARK